MKKIKKFIIVALSAIMFIGVNINTVKSDEINKYVYLGGEPFGLKAFSDGVMIVDIESFYDGEKYVCPAEKSGLKKCDIIKEINDNKIKSNEDLKNYTQNCNGETLELTIERNDKRYTKEITPIKNTVGIYLIGAWIRDSSAGIGTVTYYDSNEGNFAALGHGICDSDTGALIPLDYGEAVKANIISTDKSVPGKPGNLNGYFSEEILGKIEKNTDIGIFGKTKSDITNTKQKVKISSSSDVKIGNATLYTTIKDDIPKEYKVEIVSINKHFNTQKNNFVIKITDERLIAETGGIVQGMSGSPIIQNGKLVGAVTHVLINDPTKGYGIFIENMMEAA